jgi:hypothetical protein
MTQIINLNKHAVNVMINGENVAIAPSGTVATVAQKSVLVGEVNGVPLYRTEYGDIQGLPDPQEGVLYLVNLLVGSRAALLYGRTDLIGPDSGPTAIRYQDGPQKGQIEDVTQFVQY